MKKIYIPFVVFCVVLAGLLCPLTASAATVSSDLGLSYYSGDVYSGYYPYPDLSPGFVMARADFWTNGTLVPTRARYLSHNGVGYQFGNLWATDGYYEDKNPGGDLRSYSVDFVVSLGNVNKGDQISFYSTVWLKYVGDTVKFTLYSGSVEHWSVDVLSKSWDNQTYALEYDGSYLGPTGDELHLLIEVSNIFGYGNRNDLSFQFGKDVYWATGSSLDFVQIQQQRETIEQLSEIEIQQIATNKKMDTLIAEQEETNNILTDPKYPGADTSTSDELTSAEDKLMQDTEQGREDVEEIMSVDSFMDNLNKLMPGILAATQIMNLCFDTIAPLQTLVYIGLALGFVSFVLGTINMVVGSVRSANARKEREAKNDAYREKTFNENKRYHDAMISRRGRR